MRIGLQLASLSWPGGAAELRERLAEVASAAEGAGFFSLWVMDHFFQIPSWGTPERDPVLEAYATLGYLAGVTRRIRLGVLVTGAVYRHPSVLLKQVTTVDVLSGGRTYFGVGAAWFEREAQALGMPFPARDERFRQLEDLLRLARRTWAGDVSPFVGRTVEVPYPLSNPLPVSRPHPPILIGGGGPKRTLRLVARYADAWNVIATPSRIGEKLAILRQHCDAVGRRYESIEKTVLDPEDWRVDEDPGYRWSAEYERRRLDEWHHHGIEHVIVNVSAVEAVSRITEFGRSVIPSH
jgi:F420-dependent oxidoreductase-like protein